MYKVEIDPITGRLISYTEISDNIPVYNDDIVVATKEEIHTKLFSTKEGEAYKKALQTLQAELDQFTKEEEKDYLMRLIVDEAKDLAEARNMVKVRRKHIEEIKRQIKEKKDEHALAIKAFYAAKDAAADAKSAFKYYSAVILLIRDENRYLKEWIDWHCNAGFDHVYIYDNGIKERVEQVITAYPAEIREKITVIDWSGYYEQLQQDAYNHFLNTYKKEVRWGMFLDSDEFVRFTDGKTTSVNDFLKQYEDYTEIFGHEIEYNADGKEYYENKPVRERFTQTTDIHNGYFWKNFIQINRISHFTRHYAQYDGKRHFLFKNSRKNSDLFVIDHYYTKSWEEWQWKIRERGSVDSDYKKMMSEFFMYNPDMKHLDQGENVCQSYGGDAYGNS